MHALTLGKLRWIRQLDGFADDVADQELLVERFPFSGAMGMECGTTAWHVVAVMFNNFVGSVFKLYLPHHTLRTLRRIVVPYSLALVID